MSLAAKFFRWHRWIGYLVALQVLAWILGGLLFAWLPFQDWIKCGEVMDKPRQPLPANWASKIGALPSDKGPLLSIQSLATAQGPAIKLHYEKEDLLLSAAGGKLGEASQASVSQFARSIYKGDGVLSEVLKIKEGPRRLGMVHEFAARKNIWVARFDDKLQSRFYFDGHSGELLAARNEAWVLYDFFWRLHVMDYAEGEDFNNSLLRGTSIIAMLLTMTGFALSFFALRRSWRRRYK
ncbi:PepSY domain-containing protein [Iodobacter sp.]|uniref:PepSY domain-containing protein n=1 Tax=Iodobacter sp. TaxID=1915058 RepID=UPI0025FC5B51|nr:PepSY domain-containing protein [Iodobacter sp.]